MAKDDLANLLLLTDIKTGALALKASLQGAKDQTSQIGKSRNRRPGRYVMGSAQDLKYAMGYRQATVAHTHVRFIGLCGSAHFWVRVFVFSNNHLGG